MSGWAVTAAVPHFTFFVIRFKGVTGPVDCGFTACGGDLVGVWNIDAGCVDDKNDNSLKGCPTATLDAETTATGTVEFKADKTFDVSLTIGGSITAKIPTSCVMGASCDDLGASLKGTCTASSTGCDCSTPIDPKDSTDGGTYVTADNTFTTTSSGDTSPGDTNEYCVSGNTLKVKTVDDDGTVTILVGTKSEPLRRALRVLRAACSSEPPPVFLASSALG